MKSHYFIGVFGFLLGCLVVSHAQAVPAATRLASLQVGAGFSFALPYTAEKPLLVSPCTLIQPDYRFLPGIPAAMRRWDFGGRAEWPHPFDSEFPGDES